MIVNVVSAPKDYPDTSALEQTTDVLRGGQLDDGQSEKPECSSAQS